MITVIWWFECSACDGSVVRVRSLGVRRLMILEAVCDARRFLFYCLQSWMFKVVVGLALNETPCV